MPEYGQLQTSYQQALENHREAREALRLAEALVAETRRQAQEAWVALGGEEEFDD